MKSGKPDFILSSSAMRAKQTALKVAATTGLDVKSIQFSDALYEADGDAWMKAVRQLPSHAQTVVCIGHNPVISWFGSQLSGTSIDLAPAGFVMFESTSGPWKDFDLSIRQVQSKSHR